MASFWMRHTVVLSDIHLSEVERENGPWMRYRQRPYLPDGEIAAVLSAIQQQLEPGGPDAPRDELTLVLNGDIFDFDAPHVIDGKSVFHDLPRTAEHTVPALAAILDDHPIFVDALGHLLAEGHRLVVLSGNHDVALTLPEVWAFLMDRLIQAAAQRRRWKGHPEATGKRAAGERAAIAAQITFRPWFYRSDDGIVIEHGNQYDHLCALWIPASPPCAGWREIPPTLGSLATRHIAARLGYVNPHDERTFMLTPWGYAAHWARFYLFSRRSLALIWAAGTVRIIAALRRRRSHTETPSERRRQHREGLRASARQTGASLRAVVRHTRLFAIPIEGEGRLFAVLRELWIDRLAIIALALLLAVLAARALPGAAAWTAALAPLLVVAYERLAPRAAINEAWGGVDAIASRIAAIHRARAVILGHTHRAHGRWEGGVFLGNSGSFAALPSLGSPAATERHVIWLESDPACPDAGLSGGLYTWKNGLLTPYPPHWIGRRSKPRRIT